MATISSAGIGSGLDVNAIVTQLMAVEQRPLDALNTKQSSYQAKLTAYGTIKSGLSTLQTSLAKLTDSTKLAPLTTASSTDTVLKATASAGNGAVPGTYDLEVTQLASAQKMVAVGQTSASDNVFDTGTIRIQLGSIQYQTQEVDDGNGNLVTVTTTTPDSFTADDSKGFEVTIADGDNSLAGIRNAINKANKGVTASIVQDGSNAPYRLVITGPSGASNAMSISADGSLGTLLNYDPVADFGSTDPEKIKQTATAQDAKLSIDGLAVSSSSNNVTTAIAGVTLNLASKGKSTLSVSVDNAGVESNIKEFVDNYNKLNTSLKNLSNYDATTKKAGALNGDAAVRSVQSQMRNLLVGSVSGSTNALTRLSDVGVSLQNDGSLALNSTKLKTAITDSFTALPALFQKSTTDGVGDGFAYQMDSLIKGFLSDNGGLLTTRTDGLSATLKRLDSDQTKLEDRLTRIEKQYRDRYSKLDTVMSQLTSTSNALARQLASL